MITTNSLTKTFGDTRALDTISGGSIEIDGVKPFENVGMKDIVTIVPDELYFFGHSSMDDMANFHEGMKSGFDREYYGFLCGKFPIDPKKRISTFSKGMKRQVSLILALACRPKYLLLDEAFDGLDPVIRGAVRKILADQIAERNMTCIITSHNLRELEDICDHIGLLHLGKIVFEREIDESKLGFCKVQVAFRTPPRSDVFGKLEILQRTDTGSITTLIVRGRSDEVKTCLEAHDTLLVESVPLTLEEVFIYEMEAAGYDYANIIF
jgi:ABC-2 type transport system ATP-binding protein